MEEKNHFKNIVKACITYGLLSCFIGILLLSDEIQVPDQIDKFLHAVVFFLFFVLPSLFLLKLEKKFFHGYLVIILIISALLSSLSEELQSFTQLRTMESGDWFFNLLGASCGALTLFILKNVYTDPRLEDEEE